MKKHYPRLTPSGLFKGSFNGNRKTKKGVINSKIINNPILSFSITPFLVFNNPVFSFSITPFLVFLEAKKVPRALYLCGFPDLANFDIKIYK